MTEDTSHSERRRRAILAAAASVLEKLGYEALTMDRVAASARASKATIYRHWPSKAALVCDAFLAEVDTAIPIPDTGSAREDLIKAFQASAEFFSRRRIRIILLGVLVAIPTDEELRSAFHDRYLAPRRAAGEVAIRRGVARGELRADTDVEALFDALYGALHLRLLTGMPITRRSARTLADQVLRGIEAEST